MTGFPPPANQYEAELRTMAAQIDKQDGVPDWITFPLIYAESGWNPQTANGQFEGLLQIGPNYPGAAGKNLLDPQTNLAVGIAGLESGMAQGGLANIDYSTPNQQAYDYTLTHSGHPTWTGAWDGQQAQFEAGWQHYESGAPDNTSPYPGGGGTIGGNLGNSAGTIAGNLGISPMWSWFQGIISHPAELAVTMLALLILLGATIKLVESSGTGRDLTKAAMA